MRYLLLNLVIVLTAFMNLANAQTIESYMNNANEAKEQMDLEIAVELYTKVLALDSNNVEALYHRGWCENLWNKSKGLEDLHRVIELDSLHEGAFQALSESYAIFGEYDLAEEYKLKAISLNPKSAGNLLAQARIASDSEEFEKAIKYCSEGIALNHEGNNWLLVLERAKAYYKSGKYRKSISDFEMCFTEYQIGLYSCNEYEMCGDAYKAVGDEEKACTYWTVAVRNDDPEFDPASDNVKEKALKFCAK